MAVRLQSPQCIRCTTCPSRPAGAGEGGPRLPSLPPASSPRQDIISMSLAPLTAEQFQQLAADGHTRIPVVREVLSDLDTPLSVYLKLADGPHTYLFESVEGGERFGRYSIIGLPARRVYAFAGHM